MKRKDGAHGLPYVDHGKVSHDINVDNYKPKKTTRWFFEHKPYATDFKSELIKR